MHIHNRNPEYDAEDVYSQASFFIITGSASILTLLADKELQISIKVDGCGLDAKHDFSVSDNITFGKGSTFEADTIANAAGFFIALKPLPPGVYMVNIETSWSGMEYVDGIQPNVPGGFTADVELQVV